MNSLNKKNKILILLSLLVSFIFFITAYYISNNIVKESFENQIENQIENHYEISKNKLRKFQEERYKLLQTVVDHPKIKNDYKNNNEFLKDLMFNLVKSNSLVLQMRVLDLQGNETIRVEQDETKVLIVEKNKLQNKFHRYYFQNFLKLSKNEIAISKLDLNIENNIVQLPFVSTVRLGMPIYENNKKVGVLIVNYDMDKFLEENFFSSFFNIYLVDENNYFVKHPNNKDYNWSKYTNKTTYDTYFKHMLEQIYIKEINIFNNDYKIIYKVKDSKNIISIFNYSKIVGLIITLGILSLILPFVFILLKYLKKLKVANESLLEAKKEVELIFNNTSDAIILIDLKGKIKKVNLSTQRTFGYEQNELLGKNINILVPSPHHAKHDDYLKNHNKDMKTRVIGQSRELFGLRKDGTLVSILLTVTKVMIMEQPHFIGTIQDLTNENKNKKLFENVFNTSSIGIALVLADGSFWKLNSTFCKIVGYTSEELIKLTFQDITHKDDLEKDISLVNKILDKKIDTYTIRKRYINKKGEIVWIKLNVTGVYSDKEKTSFEYFIAAIDDITNIKQLEKQKEEKDLLLMEQSKLASMGEMVGAIAHQWRQPLNSIGFIVQDMLSAYRHDELDEEYILEIKKELMQQLNYMSETIDEFRTFFKKDEPFKEFNVVDTLKDVEKLYKAQLNNYKLKVSIELKGNKDSFVIKSQEAQLKQIFINLISNIKDVVEQNKNFTEEQRKIIIEVEEQKNSIVVSINDFVGGISDEIISRVFEPYFTTKKMGTGLGLYICKTICEKSLKARINYKKTQTTQGNKNFKGSCFEVVLSKTIQ